MNVPTIRVKSGDSFAKINLADFDHEVHEPFSEEDAALLAAPDVAPTADQNSLVEDLRKHLSERDSTIADLQARVPKTPAEVLAMFEAPDVHFQTARSEAIKLLGADAPTTKDDLVTALKKL